MTEQRFQVSFEEEPTDEPGLVLTQDGDVELVAPGGARSSLASNGGSHPSFEIATVTLTDEQIRGLPSATAAFTSPVIIPAPGEGNVLLPFASVFVRRGSGAYDNVVAGGLLWLDHGASGTQLSSNLAAAELFAPSSLDLFVVSPLTGWNTSLDGGSSFYPVAHPMNLSGEVDPETGLSGCAEDQPIILRCANGINGDYTGDGDFTLTVKVIYTVIEIT